MVFSSQYSQLPDPIIRLLKVLFNSLFLDVSYLFPLEGLLLYWCLLPLSSISGINESLKVPSALGLRYFPLSKYPAFCKGKLLFQEYCFYCRVFKKPNMMFQNNDDFWHLSSICPDASLLGSITQVISARKQRKEKICHN